MNSLVAFTLVLVAACAARAQETPSPSASPRAWAALTVGALVPGLFNRLGPAASPELTGGALLLDGRLGLGASVAFAQSSHTRTLADPRLPGGSGTLAIDLQDVRLGAGAQWHFAPGERLNPYAGARLRVHLAGVRSESAGAGAFSERWTGLGAAAYGGALYRLGPGALVGELELDAVPVAQRLLGDTNVSALTVKVGYGLLF